MEIKFTVKYDKMYNIVIIVIFIRFMTTFIATTYKEFVLLVVILKKYHSSSDSYCVRYHSYYVCSKKGTRYIVIKQAHYVTIIWQYG